MATKKQIPRKHVGKKTTPSQEEAIVGLQKQMQEKRDGEHVSWIEAKHEYFEAEEKYGKGSLAKMKTEEKQEKRKSLTIAETKLGVTVVLSHDDCRTLGFNGTMLTGAAIEKVRTELGLKTRAQLREDKKGV